MTAQQQRKINWLSVASLFWGVLGIACICPAGFFIAFYDSPIGGGRGLGGLDYLLIYSVISFPLICLGSSLAIWLLKKKYKNLAISVSFLPALLIALFFATQWFANLLSCGSFSCQGASMLKAQGSESSVGECVPPVFDGGDGLETTGCGVLSVGVIVTGSTSSSSQAHNWQFAAHNSGQMTISVENDGKTCPQIRILDDRGNVVEGFEDRNRTGLCPGGMTTTSFFNFRPPTDGTYIIRIMTPTTPGSYWLKIQ